MKWYLVAGFAEILGEPEIPPRGAFSVTTLPKIMILGIVVYIPRRGSAR